MRQKQAKGGGGTLAIVALVAFAFGRMTVGNEPTPAPPQSLIAQPAAADEPDTALVATPLETTDDTPELTVEPVEPVIDTSPRSFTASSSHEDADVEADEPSVYYRNCSAARAAGAAPIHDGEPGYAYHLDRDHDGVACE